MAIDFFVRLDAGEPDEPSRGISHGLTLRFWLQCVILRAGGVENGTHAVGHNAVWVPTVNIVGTG